MIRCPASIFANLTFSKPIEVGVNPLVFSRQAIRIKYWLLKAIMNRQTQLCYDKYKVLIWATDDNVVFVFSLSPLCPCPRNVNCKQFSRESQWIIWGTWKFIPIHHTSRERKCIWKLDGTSRLRMELLPYKVTTRIKEILEVSFHGASGFLRIPTAANGLTNGTNNRSEIESTKKNDPQMARVVGWGRGGSPPDKSRLGNQMIDYNALPFSVESRNTTSENEGNLVYHWMVYLIGHSIGWSIVRRKGCK